MADYREFSGSLRILRVCAILWVQWLVTVGAWADKVEVNGELSSIESLIA